MVVSTRSQPTKENSEDCTQEDQVPRTNMAGKENCSDNAVLAALQKLETSFNTRFEKLEIQLKTLHTNISDTVKQIVTEEMKTVKDNLDTEMDEIRGRVTILEEKSTPRYEHNIVLTNIEQSDDEVTTEKVKKLIKDGLGLNDVKVVNAERKKSRRDNVPGVIIATLESSEQRSTVLHEKKKLKSCEDESMKKVFIFPDRPWSERKNDRNLQTLIETLGSESLEWRGGRVIKRNEEGQQQNARGGHGGRGRGGQGGRGRGAQQNFRGRTNRPRD